MDDSLVFEGIISYSLGLFAFLFLRIDLLVLIYLRLIFYSDYYIYGSLLI